MSDFETISHKVSVAGRVTDSSTGKPISNARVRIKACPTAFKSFLAIKAIQFGEVWNVMTERPDRAITDAGGHFHFLDLPGGKYQIDVMLGDRNTRYGKGSTVVIVSDNSAENLKYSVADIELPSTSVTGVITDKITNQPIAFAKVRVKGSGEISISNSKGEYSLNGLEAAGNREIQVSTNGYKETSLNIELSQPGWSKILDFSLDPL